MLFKIENLSLEFGKKQIFKKAELVFNEGDKIGIVGDNGVGKTSLFNVINNKVDFNGRIFFENKNFSYLSQDEGFKELKLLNTRKEEIEKLLLNEEVIKDINKYNQLLEEYSNLIESNVSKNEEDLINKFNFNTELYLKEKKEHLSGGETTKLKLIKLFAQNFDYLLLDEPSNHLDINSKNALIEELNKIKSFIIISHDVYLLNSVCNKIIEIKNHNLNIYHGNYNYYLEQKEKEKEEIIKIQTENRKEKARIQHNIDNIKAWSQQKVKDKTQHLAYGQVLNDMGLGKGSMSSGINSTSKKLNKMFVRIEAIEIPELEKEEQIKIKYLNFEKPNEIVLTITNLEKNIENFKLKIDKYTIFSNEKVALQGDNGSGKSTLLKLITNKIKTSRGKIEIGDRVKIGYLDQKNEDLNLDNTLIDDIINLNLNMDESEIRKYLGKFLFKQDDVFKKIKNLSGGEKIRLGILKLILQGSNFLILDEPSNHLDIKSKNILAEALSDFPGCILVVSHDDYFLDKFITTKIKIKNGRLV